MDVKSIALLGTGIMGAPMARNIAKAGFSVRVWNRSIAKAEALSDVAEVFDTAQDAVTGADVVITMLKNGETVTDVLFGKNGIANAAKTGTLLVDMSSIQPSLARDHAAELKTRGLRYLDAPVSGGEKGAIDGTLAIMAGGDATDYLEAEPLFKAMGRGTHVGIYGAGQVAKLANQVIVAVSIGAVAEALLLAQEGGCDPTAVREALMGGFATSRILELHGLRMLNRDWVPGGPLELHLKDLNNALAVAKEAGLRLPLSEQARTAFHELTHDMDMGRNDHSAYVRWLEVQNPDSRLGQGEDLAP
ncbi:2-hydroxy-3-oxopropionate reductase [Rhodobacterales bacterium 52_120_T64]|nr:2-hydroxy-3-oxopropionate reductase [Rhodobacterales bacterium 52_120_T64]